MQTQGGLSVFKMEIPTHARRFERPMEGNGFHLEIYMLNRTLKFNRRLTNSWSGWIDSRIGVFSHANPTVNHRSTRC